MGKILIVDDHPVVQFGLKSMLSRHKLFQEITIAEDGKTAISKCQEMVSSQVSFSLLIVDINLPDYEILSLVKNLIKLQPEATILMFSAEPAKIHIKQLLKLGVRGFVDKNSFEEEIILAIKMVSQGKVYLSSGVLPDIVDIEKSSSGHKLSDRETEILSLMVKGLQAQEIAQTLDLHKSSISTYRARIYSKLNLKNSFELYKWALSEGLIVP